MGVGKFSVWQSYSRRVVYCFINGGGTRFEELLLHTTMHGVNDVTRKAGIFKSLINEVNFGL